MIKTNFFSLEILENLRLHKKVQKNLLCEGVMVKKMPSIIYRQSSVKTVNIHEKRVTRFGHFICQLYTLFPPKTSLKVFWNTWNMKKVWSTVVTGKIRFLWREHEKCSSGPILIKCCLTVLGDWEYIARNERKTIKKVTGPFKCRVASPSTTDFISRILVILGSFISLKTRYFCYNSSL